MSGSEPEGDPPAPLGSRVDRAENPGYAGGPGPVQDLVPVDIELLHVQMGMRVGKHKRGRFLRHGGLKKKPALATFGRGEGGDGIR